MSARSWAVGARTTKSVCDSTAGHRLWALTGYGLLARDDARALMVLVPWLPADLDWLEQNVAGKKVRGARRGRGRGCVDAVGHVSHPCLWSCWLALPVVPEVSAKCWPARSYM